MVKRKCAADWTYQSYLLVCVSAARKEGRFREPPPTPPGYTALTISDLTEGQHSVTSVTPSTTTHSGRRPPDYTTALQRSRMVTQSPDSHQVHQGAKQRSGGLHRTRSPSEDQEPDEEEEGESLSSKLVALRKAGSVAYYTPETLLSHENQSGSKFWSEKQVKTKLSGLLLPVSHTVPVELEHHKFSTSSITSHVQSPSLTSNSPSAVLHDSQWLEQTLTSLVSLYCYTLFSHTVLNNIHSYYYSAFHILSTGDITSHSLPANVYLHPPTNAPITVVVTTNETHTQSVKLCSVCILLHLFLGFWRSVRIYHLF